VYLPYYDSPGQNTLILLQCWRKHIFVIARGYEGKNLQIIQPQRHVPISGKHKRTPTKVLMLHSEDYSKKTSPHLYLVEIFFLSKLRVHERYTHLQWKDSFNSNWSQELQHRTLFSHLCSVRSITSLVPNSCSLCKQPHGDQQAEF